MQGDKFVLFRRKLASQHRRYKDGDRNVEATKAGLTSIFLNLDLV